MKFSLKGLLSLGLLLAFLTSCHTNNLLVNIGGKLKNDCIDSVFLSNAQYQYTIQKDDKINMSVWGQDDISVGSVYGIHSSNEIYGKWLLVDANGSIEIPQIGSMKVEGMTITSLKDSLKTILRKGILNPVVDVRVLNKKISVLGEVRNPASFPVDEDNVNLLKMIAQAGGFEFYANISYVKVLRQEGPNVRVANVDLAHLKKEWIQNIQLHPGDVVIVPSKKYKEFDRRASNIIPFTTLISATALFLGIL